jgi:serine/threonine protein kinase/predicted Zn-dependent protease
VNELSNRRLGDFEIIGELGRGGMGIVYEARQVSLNRKVALKVLSGGLGLTARAVQRFRREAEAAAKLHHTNIVSVYATGEEKGTHFYAMELIDGPSLDRVIRQMRQANKATSSREFTIDEEANCPLPPELEATGPYVPEAGSQPTLSATSLSSAGQYFDTVARMVAEVAEALEYAHRQGIIHRDIKPSNLLLSPGGRLSLNDFGLARILEQPGMTLSGESLGTPAYMSPEQVAVGRVPLDHRTDIYSLGATLYELLTLEHPYHGESREQILAQILHKEPKAPRQILKRVPVDLETICLKCLEKDPDRRYQSAGELAEDLRRYVNRFAISARRAGPVQRLANWVRRRPTVAASLACLLLVACMALAFAYRAHRERLQFLNEKISNAYLTATSGDLKRTDDAIKEIEALGASTGQVRLLRGVVAYFRQDAERAISELKQAVRLLPDSVAAHALLAMSYADYGQNEQSEKLLEDMQNLSPTSSEDYLFRGYAREVNEPGQGLADVNEGIQERDSTLGRALRAFVRTNQAVESGRPEDLEEAMADADVARAMRPDNQMVLFASAYARLTAAAFYQETQLAEKRHAVLNQAARDIHALDHYLGQANPTWMVWQYYDDTGKPDEALDVARRALAQSPGPIPAFYCAVSLYRRGQFDEAVKCLQRRRAKELMGDLTACFVLAELAHAGPQRALDAYEKLARKYPEVGEQAQPGYVLLLLGRKDQAQASYKEFRGRFVSSPLWQEFYAAMRQFIRGELSEEIYLAKAARSRWQLCYAHTEIGLSRLADGDRLAAREHFSKAIQTRAIWLFEWNWCEMFLSRLQNDPNWPPWIPVKKGTAQP